MKTLKIKSRVISETELLTKAIFIENYRTFKIFEYKQGGFIIVNQNFVRVCEEITHELCKRVIDTINDIPTQVNQRLIAATN